MDLQVKRGNVNYQFGKETITRDPIHFKRIQG